LFAFFLGDKSDKLGRRSVAKLRFLQALKKQRHVFQEFPHIAQLLHAASDSCTQVRLFLLENRC
jgi:hypothetical protein